MHKENVSNSTNPLTMDLYCIEIFERSRRHVGAFKPILLLVHEVASKTILDFIEHNLVIALWLDFLNQDVATLMTSELP